MVAKAYLLGFGLFVASVLAAPTQGGIGDDIPDCAQKCFEATQPVSGCSGGDVVCLCSSQPFVHEMKECGHRECPMDVVDALKAKAKVLCNEAAGVNIDEVDPERRKRAADRTRFPLYKTHNGVPSFIKDSNKNKNQQNVAPGGHGEPPKPPKVHGGVPFEKPQEEDDDEGEDEGDGGQHYHQQQHGQHHHQHEDEEEEIEEAESPDLHYAGERRQQVPCGHYHAGCPFLMRCCNSSCGICTWPNTTCTPKYCRQGWWMPNEHPNPYDNRCTDMTNGCRDHTDNVESEGAYKSEKPFA